MHSECAISMHSEVCHQHALGSVPSACTRSVPSACGHLPRLQPRPVNGCEPRARLDLAAASRAAAGDGIAAQQSAEQLPRRRVKYLAGFARSHTFHGLPRRLANYLSQSSAALADEPPPSRWIVGSASGGNQGGGRRERERRVQQPLVHDLMKPSDAIINNQQQSSAIIKHSGAHLVRVGAEARGGGLRLIEGRLPAEQLVGQHAERPPVDAAVEDNQIAIRSQSERPPIDAVLEENEMEIRCQSDGNQMALRW